MRSTTYCTLVTTGPAGPTARLVQPFPADDELVVHLGTDPTSRKARQIRADDNVLLVYQRDRDRACVVAYCRARIQEDPIAARRYFMPSWRAFWPDGPGADFVVIRCEPHALEIWDARRGITPPPFGRRCARLEYRDSVWGLDDV